jgi:outer membrane protein assembly factor BamB
MPTEYWTLRFNGARIARDKVSLVAPLADGWKHVPDGPAPGYVRAGDGAVFTEAGGGHPARLSLDAGLPVWMSPAEVCFYARCVWCLDLATGETSWEMAHPGLGLEQSYIVNDVLVGNLAREFHVIDLNTLQTLWAVPKLAKWPLVGNEDVVIWADADVVCYDLMTGAVRWQRPKADFGGEGYRVGCIWQGQFIHVLGGALTALDLKTGATIWRWPLPDAMHWWHPYDGRGYCFLDGVYVIVDLATGKTLFERSYGPTVPAPVMKKKHGLRVEVRGQAANRWRSVRVVVSETNAFLQNESGQIVVLERDTGDVVQVVEIDGMPTGAEPVIYENHLLLTDFGAAVYCFKGAE